MPRGNLPEAAFSFCRGGDSAVRLCLRLARASSTRSGGGAVRPGSRWNGASSSPSIGMANRALSTTRQFAQDAPPNHSGNASIKLRTVVEGLATSRLPWLRRTGAPETTAWRASGKRRGALAASVGVLGLRCDDVLGVMATRFVMVLTTRWHDSSGRRSAKRTGRNMDP